MRNSEKISMFMEKTIYFISQKERENRKSNLQKFDFFPIEIVNIYVFYRPYLTYPKQKFD